MTINIKRENEDFVVKEDASKSQLTKAFKTFNKKKLTNRIVLKSFAEILEFLKAKNPKQNIAPIDMLGS